MKVEISDSTINRNYFNDFAYFCLLFPSSECFQENEEIVMRRVLIYVFHVMYEGHFSVLLSSILVWILNG